MKAIHFPFSQFHYRSQSSWQVFAEESASSVYTADDKANHKEVFSPGSYTSLQSIK